ncbi:14138_t:CDS:1, partial [Gigaspora rosea]
RRFASHDIPDPVMGQSINGTSSNNADIKSSEDKKTDSFLDEVHKKKVSNEIMQRNRENKLLRESATQDLSGFTKVDISSVTKDKNSQSHKKREAENIVQDAFDFTATSVTEKNHMTKISMTGNPLPVTENTEKNSVVMLSVAKSKPLLNLACLYQKACDAEKQRIRANQDEILCWYHYVIEFDNQVKNVMKIKRIGEKKAKGQIYDFIIAQLGTKRNTLLKQTQRARSIYKLFEKIGIDKIKYITTYSANSISELSDSQIQTIIDYFTENPNTELPDDRGGLIIDSEEEISNDQDNILEEQAKPLVSATRAEDDFDKIIMEAFEEEEARIEKERQNKATSNVVTPAK